MFCSDCGHQLQATARFCSRCGASVTHPSTRATLPSLEDILRAFPWASASWEHLTFDDQMRVEDAWLRIQHAHANPTCDPEANTIRFRILNHAEHYNTLRDSLSQEEQHLARAFDAAARRLAKAECYRIIELKQENWRRQEYLHHRRRILHTLRTVLRRIGAVEATPLDCTIGELEHSGAAIFPEEEEEREE